MIRHVLGAIERKNVNKDIIQHIYIWPAGRRRTIDLEMFWYQVHTFEL